MTEGEKDALRKFRETYKKFLEVREEKIAEGIEFYKGKSVQELKTQFEKYSTELLENLNELYSTEQNEMYEMLQAIKEILEKRNKNSN